MVNNLHILPYIPHITVEGGNLLKNQGFGATFLVFKIAKQGPRILHFFTIFERYYAHDGKKWGFKIKIMTVVYVHERL